MVDTVPPDPLTTVAAIPWYKSPVQIANVAAFISAIIAMFPEVGKTMGLETPTQVSTAVTTVFAVIAIVAPAVGGFLRAKSKVQPLTMTAAKAEAHPNTVAHMAATGETPPIKTLEPT